MLILQRIVSPCNPLEPLTGTRYFTTNIINIKKFHVTPFLQPSLARVLFRGTLPLIMAQQKRGFKFALSKIESLLEVVKVIIPIGNPDWDKILNKHASHYPTKDRTAKSLKRKFQELACTKIPTGDPNMPPHIRKAKHIYYDCAGDCQVNWWIIRWC
jgi:hypothetical protein